MTAITEGITPAQFITALNNNFDGIGTVITTDIATQSLSVLNANMGILKSSAVSINAGISGSDYINKLNSNFTGAYNKVTLTFDGDSLTSCQEATTGHIWGYGVFDYYDAVRPNSNGNYFGGGGQTTRQMLADIESQVLPTVNDGNLNVITEWESVNAILNSGLNNVTGAENYADTVSYFEQCRDAGFNVRILILGYYSRKIEGSLPNWYTEEAKQELRNYYDLCKNAVNPPWTDVIDLRDDEMLGGPENQDADLTYFSDWVHLTDAGYLRIVPYVTEIVDRYL